MNRKDSTHEPAFLATVEEWMVNHGEILVRFCWRNAGGSRSYEFFREPAAFQARLRAMSAGTSVIVLREQHLPVRGTINDDLIRRATDAVPTGADYLIAGLDKVTYGSQSWYPERAGETREELVADLREWWPNIRVAVGQHPRWWDNAAVLVSAFVPDADGTVRPGAY